MTRLPTSQRDLVKLALIYRPTPRPKPQPINRDHWGR